MLCLSLEGAAAPAGGIRATREIMSFYSEVGLKGDLLYYPPPSPTELITHTTHYGRGEAAPAAHVC